MKSLGLCLCLLFWTTAVHAAPTPFFLHDGDRVVFYGDSITEQQMYARDVETFVLTRYPAMHVHFLNSGWGGDTVQGGGGGPIDLRLTRDVINYKPTVVTVFLGMNDGGYTSYDDARFQTYAKGLTHILDRLQKELPGVRLTLLTPSYFDYAAQPRPAPIPPYTYPNPAPDYNAVLLRYGNFVKRLGVVRHIPVADTNAPMAAAIATGRKTDPKYALSSDGVHPNEVGHAIIAAAILQVWHAQPMPMVSLMPDTTKAATYPLTWPLPANARDGLPHAPQAALLERWEVALPGIAGNPEQPFSLLVDNQTLGTVTAVQLVGSGVDLSNYPALPQNVQAQNVLALVQKRIDTWHDFWKGRNGLVKSTDVPTDEELAALRAKDDELNDLREQARAAAQPQTHTFQIKTKN